MPRREYNNMAERIEEYEKLLKQLSFRSDASDRTMIQKALHKVGRQVAGECIGGFVLICIGTTFRGR